MSPDGASRMGDLHELPDCAPSGLKALFRAAEGVIQSQIHLLGSGTPSKAPNLRAKLRDQGIADPDAKSTMVDHYIDHEKSIHQAISDIHVADGGIVVQTAGIGDAVRNAYEAINDAVRCLNVKIDASFQSVQKVTDKDGKVIGNRLPNDITEGLFKSVWDTLDTVYDQVHGVSDRAAAAAVNMHSGDEVTGAPTTGSTQPMSYPGSGYSGTTPWSANSGSTGAAIIPTADKPGAIAMMKYLIEKYHFTPAQAAGIIANAKFESGFDVSAKGDKGTAEGLFQWRFDRLSGLRDFANRSGEKIGDWHTHLDYMVQELHGGGYQQANAAVSANRTDPRAVAESFDRYYERSSGSTTSRRGDYAEGLLLEYTNSHSNIAV